MRNNAIALIALVFAMTGTGIAASHYVITSTKQISPYVLRKLKGQQGLRGLPGTPAEEVTTYSIYSETVNVPPGNYLVVAVGRVENVSTAAAGARCQLIAPDGVIQGSEATVPNIGFTENGETFGAATITNEAIVHMTSAGSFTQRCGAAPTSDRPIIVDGQIITATRVGSIVADGERFGPFG